MKGQGGGGTAKGGGKNRVSGEDVVIKKTKAMQTKAINENILKLRAALFNEQGQDKNVLEGIVPAFLTYNRNDINISIEFCPKLNKSDLEWCFDITQSHMEEIYDASGYGWDDDDKERELTEQGARFLLLKDAETGELRGFVHFRFTVQGEVVDQMIGQTCLYVLDMQFAPDIQRKGLGKHLLTLLELIARKQQMSRVTFPIYLGDEKTKAWLLKQGKGYASDDSFSMYGFEPEAEGFEVYSKIFVAPAPVTSGIPLTVLQSLGMTSPPPAPEKENANTTNVELKTTEAATKTKETANSSPERKEGEADKNNEEEETVIVNMEHIIGELKALYVQQHGTDPDEEIIERWKSEVKSVEDIPVSDSFSPQK